MTASILAGSGRECPVARRLLGLGKGACGPAVSPTAACYDNLLSTFDYLETR